MSPSPLPPAAQPAPAKAAPRPFSPPLSIVPGGTVGHVRLVGEADIATLDQLTDVVTALSRQPGDIVMDLAGLCFIDAASVRLLVRTAAQMRAPRQLVLQGATGIVAKVLTLLDVAERDTIRVVPAGEPIS